MSATFCFSVHTDAEPSALPRVMQVFALFDQVPARCHIERTGPDGRDLVVDAQLDGIDAAVRRVSITLPQGYAAGPDGKGVRRRRTTRDGSTSGGGG